MSKPLKHSIKGTRTSVALRRLERASVTKEVGLGTLSAMDYARISKVSKLRKALANLLEALSGGKNGRTD